MFATNIPSLIVLWFAASTALAWSVDRASCGNTPVGAAGIVDAVLEAINIAQYAAFRMSNGPAPGGIFEKLLGSNGRQSFTNKMAQLPRQVGRETITDNTVNIVCGTQYLQQASDGSWFDIRFPDMPTILPFHGDPHRRPCTSDDVAFGFPTGLTDGSPQWVVVLCGPTTEEQETFNDRVFNDDWEDVKRTDTIEVTNQFISTTVLHELLHFTNPTDLPDTLSNGETEQYTLKEIEKLPDNVKAENTESYALMASGLYIFTHLMNDDGTFTRLAPNEQPPLGPHATLSP